MSVRALGSRGVDDGAEPQFLATLRVLPPPWLVPRSVDKFACFSPRARAYGRYLARESLENS